MHVPLQGCTRIINLPPLPDGCHQVGIPSSFSCIFLLAANIISSLLLCSIFCLSSLLLDHLGFSGSSSFSFPFELIFACKLYLVIKSGSIFTGCCAPVVVDDVVVNAIGGWNDGGAYHFVSIPYMPHVPFGGVRTGSNALPPNTLSVVACTLPLFRCRSHIISRRLSWGNICEICSTCAAVKRRPLRDVEEVEEEPEREEKK